VDDVAKELDGLAKGRGTLPLAAINDDLPEGEELRASPATILRMLGKADDAEVSLQDTVDIERIYDRTAFNGDGIIPADAAKDETTHAAIAAIIGCIGSELDRSGKPGISQPLADRFFAEATAHVAWRAEAEASAAAILPLGVATEECAALVLEIGVKLDDFFTLPAGRLRRRRGGGA
jgi:hypothetical protein